MQLNQAADRLNEEQQRQRQLLTLIGATILVGHHAGDFFAPHLGLERAADAAVGASRDDRVLGLAQIDDGLLDQRRCWTGLHASAARHTFRRQERLVHARRDVRSKAATVDGQRERALNFFAGAHAARADDALRRFELEIGVRRIFRLEAVVCGAVGTLGEYVVLAVIPITNFAQSHGARHVLQFAIAVRRARKAVERMVGNIKLHHAAADVGQPGILRRDLDAGGDGRGARGGRTITPFDFTEAEAAGAERLDAVGGAELRNLNAELHRGIHDRRAFRQGDLKSVDREGHELGRLGHLRMRRAVVRLFDESHRLNVMVHVASS